jgi:hypothetical protein
MFDLAVLYSCAVTLHAHLFFVVLHSTTGGTSCGGWLDYCKQQQ